MEEAKHIAFVVPRLADGSVVGGAETLLRNLAERAARNGCRVTVLATCATNHYTWANELKPGRRTVGDLEVELFPVDDDRDIETFLAVQNRISAGAKVSREEEQAWLRNNVNSRALCAHLAEAGDQYDVMVTGPYLFGLVYHAAQVHPRKTLLVPCLHDEPFALLTAFQEMFTSVRGFMFNTEPERRLAERLYGPPSADQVASVVGMGLDDFTVDPEAFAARRGISSPYLVYSGRREPLKGTPILVEYLEAFRIRNEVDLKLVLTGSGEFPLPPALVDHIIDVGFVNATEKLEAMAGALAFCHPSVNESLGIVLLEAWLAGTPGIVHAHGEVLRYQCESSNGGLWFKTYPEFEEAVLLLLNSPDTRRALGQAGRDYVLREYAWDTVEKRLIDSLNRAAQTSDA
ncbi:MAG: glycosyltransferase family 4 protein [Kiritimatiellae bacterium]|nr:glycosyltransferase family 4 protein [Kiritimatiellia bacterium]